MCVCVCVCMLKEARGSFLCQNVLYAFFMSKFIVIFAVVNFLFAQILLIFMFEILIAGQSFVNFFSGWCLHVRFLQTLNDFFIYFSKMPICNPNHKIYYSTRAETLKTFRDEEKKTCSCRYEIWGATKINLPALIALEGKI